MYSTIKLEKNYTFNNNKTRLNKNEKNEKNIKQNANKSNNKNTNNNNKKINNTYDEERQINKIDKKLNKIQFDIKIIIIK